MPIRFLPEALATWRQFAREIAHDLSRYHRRRITEWLEGPPGGMSSYEMLELLEFMDEEGAYKRAQRVKYGGYTWSDREWAAFSTANEVAVLRAGQFPGADSDEYGGRLFIPPERTEARLEREAEAAAAREQIYGMAHISRQPGYEGAPR